MQYLAHILGWEAPDTNYKKNVNPHSTALPRKIRQELETAAGIDMELFQHGLARMQQQMAALSTKQARAAL